MPRPTNKPKLIMPLGVTDEEDIQVDDKYPYLPVDAETEEFLSQNISERIETMRNIQELEGLKKMYDGFIHEIVNEHLYTNETPETITKDWGGYLFEGEDDERVQLQVTKRYSAKTSKIKKGKETEEDILTLAEIFELEPNEDGTFPFPAGTFQYTDSIKIDPSKVHPDMFEDFVKDVRELGKKYKQGRMNPVSEQTKLIASPSFHLGRLKLPKAINLKLHQVFQNISIKLINEDKEEEKSA